MARPDHWPAPVKLDPPIFAFSLLLLSCVVQLYALILVGQFFESTGMNASQFAFAISRYVAGLAALINTPIGVLLALVAGFIWCRSIGWVIRWMMARSVTAEDINALVEPLMTIWNGAFFGLIGAGWFFAVAHICYTFS